MTGYLKLAHSDNEQILSNKLGENHIVPVHADTVGNPLGNPFKYYHDWEKKIIIVTTPVNFADYPALIQFLGNSENDLDLADYHILTGLVGHGLTEQHIVTAYQPADQTKLQIFDSKTSDPQKLIARESAFRLTGLIRGFFRSFFPFWQRAIEFPKDSDEKIQANYSTLGTQSLFDGISCGYHTVANMLTVKKLIEDGKAVNRTNILANTTKPFQTASDVLKIEKPQKVNSSLTAFIKKAWQDTFMPLDDNDLREKSHFGHYFLGWPREEGLAKKILYVITLGFILTPLINMIKLPTEFLVNVLSETANFLKNNLISWAPTTAFSQYARSILFVVVAGLQAVFKGISLAIRTVTSPVSSFKAAWKVHPALGILSSLLSIGAYASLAIFAAPAALGLLGSSVPVLAGLMAPILNALAFPVTFLLSQLSITVPTAIAAVSTFIVGSTFLAGLKGLTEKIASRFSAAKAPVERAEAKPIEGDIPNSNVFNKMSKVSSSLVKSSVDDSDDSDDFEIIYDDSKNQTSNETPALPIPSKSVHGDSEERGLSPSC